MSRINKMLLGTQNINDSYKVSASKEKISKKWRSKPFQRYTGDVLYGNIHGHGFYYIEKGEKLFYDGLFYANKLEGYAQVFYNDGSDFQGLFKSNKRFGPGVFTYPNGEQDVGLWSGQFLLRLGTLNEKGYLPKIGSTNVGKLKLLKFRYLVPVCVDYQDIAYETLHNLGASESVLKQAHKLYNPEIQNKRNIFFNREVYDKHFYIEQDCCIDIVVDEEDEDTTDTLPEEEEEEAPGGVSDINVERVRQISEELENIEVKLKNVRQKKDILQKQMVYCRHCCFHESEEAQEGGIELVELEPDPFGIDARISTSTMPDAYAGFTIDATPAARTSGEIRRSYERRMEAVDSRSTNETYSYYSELASERGDPDDESISNLDFGNFSIRTHESDMNVRIKSYLMKLCHCDEAMQIGDLYELEKELELVIKDELFFETIKKHLKQKFEMHLQKSNSKTKMKTMKIPVTNVLAWNNEMFCMRMIRHSFRNRRSEYMVQFNVSDILAGKRTNFGDPGPHEQNCLQFLAACSNGDIENIFNQIKNEVNVNVCDARGNSGIFFASIKIHMETIKVLVNLGAKLDQTNDEGLSILSMCLLVHLAAINHVDDWEKSFLPAADHRSKQEGAHKFYPNMSLVDLLRSYDHYRESSIPEMSFNTASVYTVDIYQEAYIFDTGYVITEETNAVKKSSSEDVVPLDKTKSVVLFQDDEPPPPPPKTVVDVIKTLLDFGANPNASETPLPLLFLALFSEDANLVECILVAGADISVSIEHDMTALHVIASLKCSQENVDMCSFLIVYDCDPKLKTATSHWQEQKQNIIGKGIDPDDVVDCGKNPLHVLCMRKDYLTDNCNYFKQMSGVLLESSLDVNEKYLGHTPLSLAVLVGNLQLVQSLMRFNYVDPYLLLDNNMGNVLTIYILKRYQDLIPSSAKEILTYLVEAGVNPLKSIGDSENAIAFMDKEHDNIKDKNSKKDKNEKQPKAPKKETKAKGLSQKELMEHIVELARNTIIMYIQMFAVENLYNLVEDNLTDHEYVTVLAQFLDPDVVITNVQKLFKHGKIKSERFDKSVCLRLIEIITEHQKDMKLKKGPSQKKANRNSSELKTQDKSKTSLNKARKKPDVKKIVIKSADYDLIIDKIDFKRQQIIHKYRLSYPGLDNLSKYQVCFHCLKSKDKILSPCPRCQLIYFCSVQCNKANMKLKTLHKCNIVFYNSELLKVEYMGAPEDQENISELLSAVKIRCEQRYQNKIDEENELERKLVEEEKKADVYGTKMLKKSKQLKFPKRTPTVMSLCGSISQISKTAKSDLVHVRRKLYGSASGIVRHKSSTMGTILRKTMSDERYSCMLNRKHVSSLSELKVAEGDRAPDRLKCRRKNCGCKECAMTKQTMFSCSKNEKLPISRNVFKGPRKLKVKDVRNTDVIIKKLRMIPGRYREFIELLTTYFPEVDFSSLLLPYACYSNGHLYYKFLDEDVYARSYSMV